MLKYLTWLHARPTNGPTDMAGLIFMILDNFDTDTRSTCSAFSTAPSMGGHSIVHVNLHHDFASINFITFVIRR